MFQRITPAVKNLLIINVIMFIGTWAVTKTYGIDLNEYLGLYFFRSEHFHFFQYVSYMFMHGGFLHIFMNMWALYMFGVALEQVWGSKRFLIFYFVTGIGAALVHTLVNYIELVPMVNSAHAFMNTPSPELFSSFLKNYVPDAPRQLYDFINQWSVDPTNQAYINEATNWVNKISEQAINVPTVGASGAVFGVLLGFGMLFPNTQLMLLFPPIPIKAKYFVMIYGAIELYLAIQQPGSHIAHFAHIGGMIFGFIMIKMWNKDKQHFY